MYIATYASATKCIATYVRMYVYRDLDIIIHSYVAIHSVRTFCNICLHDNDQCTNWLVVSYVRTYVSITFKLFIITLRITLLLLGLLKSCYLYNDRTSKFL